MEWSIMIFTGAVVGIPLIICIGQLINEYYND